MDFREWRAQMQRAVRRRDGAAVVALLGQNGSSENVLQLVGEGLLAALTQDVDLPPDLTPFVVKALRERNWEGDGELADHLEGLLGVAAMPSLRPLPIDLDKLARVREGDWAEGILGPGGVDLETGEVWFQSEIVQVGTVGSEEQQRWLWVVLDRTRRGARYDMEDFINGLGDLRLIERMRSATETTDAFRRFEGALSEWPIELEQWHAFCDDRRRGRSRSWLAVAGYCQAPPTKRRLGI